MVASDIVPARLEDLFLARVAYGSSLPSSAALAKELAVFAPTSYDSARWQSALDATRQRLEAAGRLHQAQVDEAERRALAQRLDLHGQPWRAIRTQRLPRLAFGPAPSFKKLDRLASREAWAAAIVARATGLWHQGAPPSPAAVCDALVWRSLKLAGKAKRTPPEIRAHFLTQILAAGSGPPGRLLALMAAREIDAPRADLNALRDALVRRWLRGIPWAGDVPAHPALAIDDFASAVRQSASHATEGVFGGRKVFISSLWQGMRARPPVSGMTLDEFKHQLVLAHRAGLVELVRADLTAAMDPGVLRESETAHLEARYHFVERGGLS